MAETYMPTPFGKTFNGHLIDYKGEKYPSFLFKRGKPITELVRYLQIERLFN